MKKRILIFFTALLSLFGHAQDENSTDTTPETCQDETKVALTFLTGSDTIATDFSKGIALLTQLAEEDCVDAIVELSLLTKKNHIASVEEEEENLDSLDDLINLTLPNTLLEAMSPDTSINPCKNETYMGFMLLTGNDIIVKDIPKGIALLTQLADEGCDEAQLRLGLVYKKNTYVNIDEHKAFEYIQKAANQELPSAIAELGLLYQLGIGCTLNYDEALRLYEKAYDLGEGMGAYCIGYCHFKGLATVEQSYEKAIEWFTKSDYPMAQHWLGIFHYFGYGMPVDKEKAYELLITNTGIKNSQALLTHLENSKDEVKGILSDYKNMDIEQETEDINELLETDNGTAEINEDETMVTAQNLSGTWMGKLVEIEWSGERILRDFPASFAINADETAGKVNYTADVNGHKHTKDAIVLDESLYFQNFTISLPRLYQDDVNISALNYAILNIDFQIKTINHVRFLVGFVDTKIMNWNEPGPPMLLVLANEAVLTENGVEISRELLDALLDQQGTNFINLYPNPFKDDLLVQYELDEDTQTSVEIYNFQGTFSETIASEGLQKAGKKIFQYNGSDLQSGMYVVRVIAGDAIYTKLIVKE